MKLVDDRMCYCEIKLVSQISNVDVYRVQNSSKDTIQVKKQERICIAKLVDGRACHYKAKSRF